VSEVPGIDGEDYRVYGPFRQESDQPPAEPASGQPATSNATSAPPYHAHLSEAPVQPSGPPATDSWSAFSEGGPGSPNWQPRIVPTPKPPPGRILRAGLLGLLGGLLVFAPAGYAVGHLAAPEPAPKPPPTPAATRALLPPFEQNQLTLNKAKFTGPLATVAEPWMPYISNCAKESARAGDGEAIRLQCHYDAVSVYFVQYRSTDDRDKARTRYVAQSIDAKQLTPGAGGVSKKKTTSGRANGDYLEFAFRSNTDPGGRVVSGIWWDNTATPVAAYMLAFWPDVGESWEPLRDVWHRYG
jgi:hypothetical protein